MQKVIPFISLLLLSSCGSSSFVSSVMNKANTSEIITFKNYLQQINVMNDFKEYRNNNYPKNDTVIRAFFKKYKIQTLVVKPCVPGERTVYPYGHFENCGPVIELRYGLEMITQEHLLLLDYSSEGLRVKNKNIDRKNKVADRIYVF